MDIEKRLALIREVGEEIVTEQELRNLLQTKTHPVAYDGFEPSGKVHIAQGIVRAINVNKMVRAGVRFKMLVANWHAWANNKLGGDLKKIETAGEYMVEVWKASGMELGKIDFVRSTDLVNEENYWKNVMKIARISTVKRITRCAQIMGRSESDTLAASQILYPCMQAADIFGLKCDLTQLGMDQRKVNMLAREVGPTLGFWKPVVISHHMLMGLQQVSYGDRTSHGKMSAMDRSIGMKMSKSKPDSAIFMTDTEQEIKRKLSKAYCQEKQTEENPVLEYCRHIVFEKFKTLEIERPAKFGGDLSVPSYGELVKLYRSGGLHPADLKAAVASRVNELVEPVRMHFKKNKRAAGLLKQVDGFDITR